MFRPKPRLVLATSLVTALGVLAPFAYGDGGTTQPATACPQAPCFQPQPASQPIYGVRAPEEDRAHQQTFVQASGGVQLFVRTWLPVKDGQTLDHVPTILIDTPYEDSAYNHRTDYRDFFATWFAKRGYAVSIADVRGTGKSGGCLDEFGPTDEDDVSRVVEYAGTAPWADGNVGMLGLSHEGVMQYVALGAEADPEHPEYAARLAHLKAVVPMAGEPSFYDYSLRDGVPMEGDEWFFPVQSYRTAHDIPETNDPSGGPTQDDLTDYANNAPRMAQHMSDRPGCASHQTVDATKGFGDFTDWYKERDYRPAVPHVHTAVLYENGIWDDNVYPINGTGFFDRLPADVPHKALLGQWEHMYPDHEGLAPALQRTDWRDMMLAWFDRFLRGLDTGVENWPDVQVQDTAGYWRAEPNWPTTGGPVGQLALFPGAPGQPGRLGPATPGDRSRPDGSTSYPELSTTDTTDSTVDPVTDGMQVPADLPDSPHSTGAVFEATNLPGDLHITGQPELRLWVTLTQPDAHIAVALDAFDANGKQIFKTTEFGLRSAQHLDPIVDGDFRQATAKPAPVGTAIPITVRLTPTDVVVPAGGTVRLRIAGMVKWNHPALIQPSRTDANAPGYVAPNNEYMHSMPSGSTGTVTIFEDCEHPSVLRFLMPRADAQYFSAAQQKPAWSPLPAVAPGLQDGGGLATTHVCGHPPMHDDVLGPVRGHATYRPLE